MKKFLFIALGATLVIQGLYEWLVNGNEALASLPFALAFACFVIYSSISSSIPKKQDDGLGIFGHPYFFEICAVVMLVTIIISFIGFVIWLMIFYVFPFIDWKYCLSLLGSIITVIFIGGVIYYLNELWGYMMDTDGGIPFWKKAKNKMLFPILLLWVFISPDRD